MSKRFVSEPLKIASGASGAQRMEPVLPQAFEWRGERVEVRNVRKTWRSTKEDRGDVYLKRHWFEFESADACIVTVYYDRAAKRSAPHWWLYSIEDAAT